LNNIKYFATILLITIGGFAHSIRQPPLLIHNCHLFIFFLRCHINDILGNKNPNTFYLGNKEIYLFILKKKKTINILYCCSPCDEKYYQVKTTVIILSRQFRQQLTNLKAALPDLIRYMYHCTSCIFL